MRNPVVIALVCVLAALTAVSAGKDDVIAISGQKEFDAALQAHPFIVVEFYAPVSGTGFSNEQSLANILGMHALYPSQPTTERFLISA